MANPPSYEESAADYSQAVSDEKSGSKGLQYFSLRDEVGTSRSQHVAALVSKLLPQVRERARSGLSRSALLLLPSNKDCGRRGQLVGFPEDELPILIQLEGHHDSLEFWMQQEALDLLREQMLAAVSDGVPTRPAEAALPTREPLQTKQSFFGRKASKVAEAKASAKPVPLPPVTVQVLLDEVHFRTETEYGLFETVRGRAVVVSVVVR
ncbi:hypothetical protein LTR85_007546 [Meristemomyces frigidus]|nr:hypothetical protein LTR85_007546 [Meristemomyces frigidus]